jgi:Tol biopolymer transport system component
MNPNDPKTDRLVTQVSGGGWAPLDWSPDDKRILVMEGISVNESYLWLVDVASGQRTAVTPHKAAEPVAYGGARFSKDGKGVYYTTDQGSEFQRLVYMDLTSKQTRMLTQDIPWDVEQFELSFDGRKIALVANEDGLSTLHLLDAATGKPLNRTEIAARSDWRFALASEQSRPSILLLISAEPLRLLLGGCDHQQSGALDNQRNGRAYRCLRGR